MEESGRASNLDQRGTPAIVDKILWETVSRMNRRVATTRPNQHSLRSTFLLSGLLRCAQCGFGFQGQSPKAKGHSYPKYVDSGWANKRVCQYFGIPQRAYEEAVLRVIRNTMMKSRVLQHVEQQLNILKREIPRMNGGGLLGTKVALVGRGKSISFLRNKLAFAEKDRALGSFPSEGSSSNLFSVYELPLNRWPLMEI